MKLERKNSKSSFSKADKETIQNESLESAKTTFFKGEGYLDFKGGLQKRQYLAASIMERIRCKCLVELYDLQLEFLNNVVRSQKLMVKVRSG